MDDVIQIIESQIDLINRANDLYDLKYCSPENEGCPQPSYLNIGEFVPMKKHNCNQSGFKYQYTSINVFDILFLECR